MPAHLGPYGEAGLPALSQVKSAYVGKCTTSVLHDITCSTVAHNIISSQKQVQPVEGMSVWRLHALTLSVLVSIKTMTGKLAC